MLEVLDLGRYEGDVRDCKGIVRDMGRIKRCLDIDAYLHLHLSIDPSTPTRTRIHPPPPTDTQQSLYNNISIILSKC